MPYSGVLTIAVSRYEVASHDRSRRPWRSPTIVGSAVATTVVSSDESAFPIMSPMNTIQTLRVTAVPVVVNPGLPSRRAAPVRPAGRS